MTDTDRAFVYFVRVGRRGPIKVGFSEQPLQRIRALQAGIPDELRLLGVVAGGLRFEAYVHETFAALRIHGEWFRAKRPLLEFIRAYARPLDVQQPEPAAPPLVEKVKVKPVPQAAVITARLERVLAMLERLRSEHAAEIARVKHERDAEIDALRSELCRAVKRIDSLESEMEGVKALNEALDGLWKLRN